MAYSQETKRLWRWVAVLAVVGVLAAAGLWFYFVRARDEQRRRRIVAANEREAVLVVDGVAAAQQLHLQSRGEYGTFPQLVEAGVFRAPALRAFAVAAARGFRAAVFRLAVFLAAHVWQFQGRRWLGELERIDYFSELCSSLSSTASRLPSVATMR